MKSFVGIIPLAFAGIFYINEKIVSKKLKCENKRFDSNLGKNDDLKLY